MDNLTESKVYRAALYVRLSKEDGDKEESDSIVNQKDLIRAFLADKPDIHICAECVDDGYSGANFDRPSFKQMIRDIEAGRIDCVVVKDDCVIIERNTEDPEKCGFCGVRSVF